MLGGYCLNEKCLPHAAIHYEVHSEVIAFFLTILVLS